MALQNQRENRLVIDALEQSKAELQAIVTGNLATIAARLQQAHDTVHANTSGMFTLPADEDYVIQWRKDMRALLVNTLGSQFPANPTPTP